MTSQALANNSLIGGAQSDQPYIIYALSNRPPGSAGSNYSGGSGGGAHGRDPIQVLCPYTGSNVTGAHPLRVPSSSSKSGAFGVRCMLPVPLTNMMGGGGDDANATVFVGHGGAGGSAKALASRGGKDDHAFLVSRQSSGGAAGNGTNPRWKVRLPETLSSTHQSMAISPDGRYLAAGSVNGTCFLWEWTNGEDNLVKTWKAHYRPLTCLAFDKDDGATLFSAGEDGVVNAWSLLDLVDQDNNNQSGGGSSIHPFQTWSEHHLPVTSLCVLPGSGRGSTRLVSSSLDRNLIIMELGGSNSASGKSYDGSSGARTLARMCLPTGLHTVISDSSSGRLYGGGADGNVYCVDLCKHAIQETLDGAGMFVNVNQSGGDDLFLSQVSKGGSRGSATADFASVLSGKHVLPSATPASSSGLSNDQSNYISELKGHVKAVTSLALLDPAALASSSNSGKTALLASGSDDGTLRVWDLHSRSCVKVLRPWSPSSEGMNIGSATSTASSPPITAIIAVPKSSLTSYGGSLAMSSSSTAGTPVFRSNYGKRGNASGDLASLFKPLKGFVRGTSMVNSTESSLSIDCAPILWPRRDESFAQFWEDESSLPRKRARSTKVEGDIDDSANDKVEIARLRKALAESEVVVERWQTVNNQLVSKLKSQG